MSDRVLSRPMSVTEIHGQSEMEVEASADERTALAFEYDLVEVSRLRATAELVATSSGVDVRGRVTADIVQSCVVTLEPVAQHIDEPFSVRLVRPGSPALAEFDQPGDEIVVDPAAADPPDLLEGNAVDVGAIVEEALVLAIDPYPRAPGATLPAEVGGSAGEEPPGKSPFAVLAALKDKKS